MTGAALVLVLTWGLAALALALRSAYAPNIAQHQSNSSHGAGARDHGGALLPSRATRVCTATAVQSWWLLLASSTTVLVPIAICFAQAQSVEWKIARRVP